MSGPPPEDRAIEIGFRVGKYFVREEGRADREAIALDCAINHVHRRLTHIASTDMAGRPMIHAGSLRYNGRRVILVGSGGTGKTTLTLRLLQCGFDFEADEHVFITHNGALARPRPIRIKQTSLRFLPEIHDKLDKLPSVPDHLGRRIVSLDPRRAGWAWRIEEGPVDVIIRLHANHGGASSIRPIGPLQTTRAILDETLFEPKARGAGLALMAAMTSRARGYDLSLGDHPAAERLICNALR